MVAFCVKQGRTETALLGALLLVLGCDDCHARMLSSGKPRLEAAGYTVPYIDFDLLDDITQKRRFYELCDELDIPTPHLVLRLQRERPGRS